MYHWNEMFKSRANKTWNVKDMESTWDYSDITNYELCFIFVMARWQWDSKTCNVLKPCWRQCFPSENIHWIKIMNYEKFKLTVNFSCAHIQIPSVRQMEPFLFNSVVLSTHSNCINWSDLIHIVSHKHQWIKLRSKLHFSGLVDTLAGGWKWNLLVGDLRCWSGVYIFDCHISESLLKKVLIFFFYFSSRQALIYFTVLPLVTRLDAFPLCFSRYLFLRWSCYVIYTEKCCFARDEAPVFYWAVIR